jgi:hypothetical protein
MRNSGSRWFAPASAMHVKVSLDHLARSLSMLTRLSS